MTKSDALEALREAVNYLDENEGRNSIGSGSILHRQMRAALEQAEASTAEVRAQALDEFRQRFMHHFRSALAPAMRTAMEQFFYLEAKRIKEDG